MRGATQQPGSTVPHVPEHVHNPQPHPQAHPQAHPQPHPQAYPQPHPQPHPQVPPPPPPRPEPEAGCPGNNKQPVDIDYKAEPLPELKKPPRDGGRLRTNHFEIKHKSDLILWQYRIKAIKQLKPKKDDDVKGKITEDQKVSDSHKDADRDNDDGQQGSVENGQPGGNTPDPVQPFLHDAKLNARMKRRVIFMLLTQLRTFELAALRATRNPPHKPTAMASNYIDTVITAEKLIAPEVAAEFHLSYYDEDHTGPAEHPRTYFITLSQPTLVDIGGLQAYLTGQIPLSATTFTDLQTTRTEVINALNIVFSTFANQQSTRWSLPLSEYVHTRSLEPIVSAVGSQKFFAEYKVPLVMKPDEPPWTVPGEDHLVALPGFFRSTRAPYNSPFLLNVNTTTSAFYKWILLSDLVQAKFDDNRPWRDVEKFVRGLRVRTTYMVEHLGHLHERIFTVAGLPGTAECYLKDESKRKPFPWSKQKIPYPSQVGFTPDQGTDGKVPQYTTIQRYFKDLSESKARLKIQADEYSGPRPCRFPG